MKSFLVPRSVVVGLVALILGLISVPDLPAQTATVNITFRNLSSRKLTLNTAAPGQAMRPAGDLGPGDIKSMPSAPGQNWVVLLVSNRVYAEYLATQQVKQVFTLTDEGGFAGPADQVPMPQGKPVPAPVPAPAAVTGGNTGSRVTAAQSQQIVTYHNQKRAEVGNGKVVWSPQIAQFAQQRADTIARTRKFAHLPSGQNPYGENLAQGGGSGGSGFTVISACDGWYAEKSKMPKNARTMSVDLFNRGVGHYTQMVWKGSNQIGAGIAQYQQGGISWTVVVCCYSPAGNVIGGAIF